MSTDAINSLRQAVKSSPDNVHLRSALADMLLGVGKADEAEAEFKQALSLSPDDAKLKTGLATAFYAQGKTSAAMVIVEDLIKKPDVPAKAHMLYARLLHRAGDIERSVRQYKKAVESDPSVADAELAARLGIQTDQTRETVDDVVDGKVRAAWEDPGGSELVDVERPSIKFKDVGGLEDLKEEIRMKIIHPLKHPELYKAYGKAIGGGILMYGPPGCGKTYLARATAGEINASFLSVGINDVLDMWIGNSEKNLHQLFDRARRTTPCVLFFDEVDALAASRRADMHFQ